MHKIATTDELQHELRQLIDYARRYRPSRVVLASRLSMLSQRIAIRRDANREPKPVGLEWNADNGRSRIERIEDVHGQMSYVISSNGSHGYRVVPLTEDMDRYIKVDEQAFARNQSRQDAIQERADAAEAKKVRSEWFGFTEGLTPIQRGRVDAALTKPIRSNGILYKRVADLITERVKDGWRTGNNSFGRIFEGRDGTFIEGKKLGKLALEFAEFLVAHHKV